MNYSKKRREAIIKKMLPPENKSISEIANKEGSSPTTLNSCRQAASEEGHLLSENDTAPSPWTLLSTHNMCSKLPL